MYIYTLVLAALQYNPFLFFMCQYYNFGWLSSISCMHKSIDIMGDWKVSELESVGIHFLPILKEIGKC